MDIDLSFIMCSYNEKGRIEDSFRDLLESLSGRKEKVEVLFIDNGSTDGTREWLKEIRHPFVRVHMNERNLGKGGSIKKGLGLARGRFVVIHDPDYEYRAADVWKCYDHALKTDAAFVLGSRVLGQKAKYCYFINYLGVRVLTTILNLLYGCRLTDSATAMKLLRSDFIRKIRLECGGFDFDFELVTRVARAGGKIAEVPAQYFPRTVAQGKKIKPVQDGLAALRVILKDRFVPLTAVLKDR